MRSLALLVTLLAATRISAAADNPAAGTNPSPETTNTGSSTPDSGHSAEEQDQFAALKARFLQKQGINTAAATVVSAAAAPATQPVVPGGGAPPVPGGEPSQGPQPSWETDEKRRAADFNKQFGDGAYERVVDFNSRCFSKDGCNKLALGGIIHGADAFVDLEKKVEAKTLTRDSSDYKSQDDQIKGGLRGAMNQIHAMPNADPAYEAELIKVSDPIVKKVFTPAELIQYAQRNAASSDSPNYYAYLGQKLNAGGSPQKAREAFDAALDRDPQNQQALSGRAEARYELGDFPGAVKDARAALSLNPGDSRALTALKFSEGRAPGAPGEMLPTEEAGGGSDSGPAGGAGSAGGLSDGWSAGAGVGAGAAAWLSRLARAGASVPQEAVRRSESLVTEAKRSLTLGDAKSAVAMLRRAVEINPGNAQAYSLASMAYSRLKNYEAAFIAAESGLKLAPRSGPLLDAKAFALNHLKDYRGALAAADLALSVNRADPMAHFNRAAALGGLNDRAGMLAALGEAAKLDPKFEPILAAAVDLPQTSDILFLFPGEGPARAPAAARLGTPGPSKGWIAGAAAAVAAGLALILGLRTRRAPAAVPPPLESVRRAPSLLGGKYELGRELGSGGMGVVYEGKDVSLSRAVAVKRMREELRWDPRERERFVREAKTVAKLKHPNIVEVYAIVEEGDEVYLVFEYVSGRTLHDQLWTDKKIPFAKARQLFRGIVSALDYAHERGVVHRDLKPANIMADADGRARVMDFGIARLTEEAVGRHSRTKTGTAVGTPLYMAPEQELGKARKESDVFALAVCLYECLTGARPFAGTGAGLLMNKLNRVYEPPSKVAAGLPAGIDEVFARAFEPEPEKRYSSAGALLRALESLEA